MPSERLEGRLQPRRARRKLPPTSTHLPFVEVTGELLDSVRDHAIRRLLRTAPTGTGRPMAQVPDGLGAFRRQCPVGPTRIPPGSSWVGISGGKMRYGHPSEAAVDMPLPTAEGRGLHRAAVPCPLARELSLPLPRQSLLGRRRSLDALPRHSTRR